MAEELFDVVGALDEVIETLPRSEVHRRKLLHRAIHVLVFRSDGAMLIHKRSATKEEFPSVWTSSCSGHVSAGETYDETAPREMFEELGIAAAVTALRKFDACPETSHEFTMLYTASSDDPIVPDAQEMTDIRWMMPTEIEEWTRRAPEDFSPAFLLLFRPFLSDPVLLFFWIAFLMLVFALPEEPCAGVHQDRLASTPNLQTLADPRRNAQ